RKSRADGLAPVAFARLSVVQMLLLDLLLERGLVAMLRALLLLHGAAGGGAEPRIALHREGRRDQPLQVRPAARRAGRLSPGAHERLELPRTRQALELVERHVP